MVGAGLCAAGLAVGWGAAVAIEAGITEGGRLFVVGGIGEGEIARLDRGRDNYSLWVITAAKVSGAYVADATLRITDKRRRVILDRILVGPWLLIDLPPGRFTVAATYRGESHTRVTTIHPGDHHQIVFYFDVPDDVRAQGENPASAK